MLIEDVAGLLCGLGLSQAAILVHCVALFTGFSPIRCCALTTASSFGSYFVTSSFSGAIPSLLAVINWCASCSKFSNAFFLEPDPKVCGVIEGGVIHGLRKDGEGVIRNVDQGAS